MIEPNIAEQLLGVAVIFIILFSIMVLTAKEEQKVEEVEEQEDFYTIARMNIRNCDRQFTYDTQKPEGLRPELLALPHPKG
ncbi:hypothetical protein [Streptococcus mitis]|uniref:hypothetical protein n=1 Tax=Streptococcus mitis TaxID=28037 RepID=UPI0011597BEB|nr:hypothetical protein [Streptococcus mitis]